MRPEQTIHIDHQQILQEVKTLALKVGDYQRTQLKHFQRSAVERKGSHDYVSYVDKESERMIVENLRRILPQAHFITEEQTTEQENGTGQYVWIVDPLDGTTNYIHGLGPWCVCIALKGPDELEIGVVYEVSHDELFYAAQGTGAWVETQGAPAKRLKASDTTDIDQALVIVGYPYNADEYKKFCLEMTDRLYGRCASIRSLGSAEAEICYVAAGRIDIYFESYLHPWDVCAGAVILKEAGGRISDYEGTDRLWPSGRQMLATNGVLHDAMLDIMLDE